MPSSNTPRCFASLAGRYVDLSEIWRTIRVSIPIHPGDTHPATRWPTQPGREVSTA